MIHAAITPSRQRRLDPTRNMPPSRSALRSDNAYRRDVPSPSSHERPSTGSTIVALSRESRPETAGKAPDVRAERPGVPGDAERPHFVDYLPNETPVFARVCPQHAAPRWLIPSAG